MAKKRETIDTASFLTSLQSVGYFRKISDRVQVGIPDIIGCFHSTFFGIEAKSVKEVTVGDLVPPLSSHTFSAAQKRNLKEIEDNAGIGLAVVICGRKLCYAFSNDINADGQIIWDPKNTIDKSNGKWPVLAFLDYLVVQKKRRKNGSNHSW